MPLSSLIEVNTLNKATERLMMEKITDKIAGIPNDGTYFSLEFFPPKTQMVLLSHTRFSPLTNSEIRDSPIYKSDSNVCPAFYDRFSWL